MKGLDILTSSHYRDCFLREVVDLDLFVPTPGEGRLWACGGTSWAYFFFAFFGITASKTRLRSA